MVPCLLQVLLRLPAMHAWVEMHADHCTNSRGCALCWLKVVREAMSSEVGRRNVSVVFLPEGVSSRDVQGLKLVFDRLMEAFSKTEIASGRIGEFPVAASSSVTVTHVDRLFGWMRQTRSRCEACCRSQNMARRPRRGL